MGPPAGAVERTAGWREALGRPPRNVWLIGLISLVNDSASELIYPLLPLVLTSLLAAGPRALGLVEGLAEASASLLKLFSGVILDRTGRPPPCWRPICRCSGSCSGRHCRGVCAWPWPWPCGSRWRHHRRRLPAASSRSTATRTGCRRACAAT